MVQRVNKDPQIFFDIPDFQLTRFQHDTIPGLNLLFELHNQKPIPPGFLKQFQQQLVGTTPSWWTFFWHMRRDIGIFLLM